MYRHYIGVMETYTFFSHNLFRKWFLQCVGCFRTRVNIVKGLYTIYNMNSTAHVMDNNFKKLSPDKKENKVRGLYTIYNMNSTA